MRPGYSLRRRLFVAMLLVLVLGVGATTAFYFVEVGALGKDLRSHSLRSQARELLASMRPSGGGAVAFDLPADWADAYARPGSAVFYTLYDAVGRIVATSPNLKQGLPFSPPPDREKFGSLRLIGVGADRLAAVSARAPDGRVLVVARGDISEETLAWSLIEEDLEYLGVVFIPFALAALVLVWFISAWSLRPLARVSREAAAVGPGNLAMRLTADGLPGEIRPLVDAVNGALDRLAEAYAAERRLTADAAHELRTPLAVLSLRLQRAKLDGATDWPAIERETARMGRLVGQLLDLARKEGVRRTDRGDRQALNLSRIIREAAAAVLPIAEETGRPVGVEAPEVVPIRGSADDLRDMVRNLLENALVHGSGAVSVSVRQQVSGKGQSALVEVADEGGGIPEALREAVFERFRKGRAASPGAGLGLAIVRHVVRAHDGEVCFLPGPGCRIRISLPVGDGSG